MHCKAGSVGVLSTLEKEKKYIILTGIIRLILFNLSMSPLAIISRRYLVIAKNGIRLLERTRYSNVEQNLSKSPSSIAKKTIQVKLASFKRKLFLINFLKKTYL